tara:strand:- start:13579 stop:13710 length:132 start_codon:yes stop_codon:yes gene_type:complete
MDLAGLWDIVKDEHMTPKAGFVLITLINHVEATDLQESAEEGE